MRTSTAALLALLLPLASAHFSIIYPTPRGDTEVTQATSPCGGLNTPSTKRTPWPITGGKLEFKSGHDEADTAVYLAIGNNPTAADFNITLKNVFRQVGLGTFCWNEVDVAAAGVKEGVNATLQIVQAGHTGGGLYNCADITFEKDISTIASCSNSTGVYGEPLSTTASSTGSSPVSTGASKPSTTASGAPAATSSSAADSLRMAGGAAVAAVIGAAAWLI